jgi:hypothetical protein
MIDEPAKLPEPSRQVTQPVWIGNKPLKAEFKGLFASLTKVAVGGVSHDWGKVAEGVAGALSSIGLEDKPEELAWVLLRRAMANAVVELVKDGQDLLPDVPPDGAKDAGGDLDEELARDEIELDKRWFERPGDLSIVVRVQDRLNRWLKTQGLNDASAAAVTARLPTYFAYALSNEWRRTKDYLPIKAVLDTPSTGSEEREQQWSVYADWLKREADRRMFAEPFGLRQVFVPLRAYFERRPKEASGGAGGNGAAPSDGPGGNGINGDKIELIVADLRDALDAWLLTADPNDSVLGGVDVSGANLAGADLTGANLAGVNLTGANLAGADLTGANLDDVDLTGANLDGANLTGANLAGVNLAGANLTGANMNRARLCGTNLNGASLGEADAPLSNRTVDRYRELVRIKHIRGLTEVEATEMSALDAELEKADGPFYDPIIASLRQQVHNMNRGGN